MLMHSGEDVGQSQKTSLEEKKKREKKCGSTVSLWMKAARHTTEDAVTAADRSVNTLV